MFKDQIECFQAIAKALTKGIPEEWSSIEVEAKISGNSVDLLVVYFARDGRRENIGYVPMLARCFFELSRLTSTAEKGFFNVCNFTLKNDGQYKTDYIYQ